MSHWEELASDFRHAIEDGANERTADMLAEFALAAPASAVRRYHEFLVESSARCADAQVRDHFLSTLELVRQRASMTRSSLVPLAPQRGTTRKRTIAHLPTDTRDELGKQAARGRRRGGQPGRTLEDRNRQQLYELAREKDIPGRSKMGKRDLIEAIRRVR